jgi:hypothetical protein
MVRISWLAARLLASADTKQLEKGLYLNIFKENWALDKGAAWSGGAKPQRTKVADGRRGSIISYSTHHEIKNTPLVLRVFLWRYVSHCNSRNFLTARDRIFFFFCRSEEKAIYKSYTLDIVVRLTPKSVHPRSQIKNTPFSYNKRRVKTGFKILISFLCLYQFHPDYSITSGKDYWIS